MSFFLFFQSFSASFTIFLCVKQFESRKGATFTIFICPCLERVKYQREIAPHEKRQNKIYSMEQCWYSQVFWKLTFIY